jgi:hypothetical protein
MTVTKDESAERINLGGLCSLAVPVWPYTGLNNHECYKHSTGTTDENTASLF